MIKNLIFDLGDVFINLNFEKVGKELLNVDDKGKMDCIQKYEEGYISTNEFVTYFEHKLSDKSKRDVVDLWNSLLGDLPNYRMKFLQEECKGFNKVLLSNTNALHVSHFSDKYNARILKEFMSCFLKTYYSFEMKLKKPDPKIFKSVLFDQGWNPEETLFIDDNLENIESAKTVDLKTWHLKKGEMDVVDLFKKNTQFFYGK